MTVRTILSSVLAIVILGSAPAHAGMLSSIFGGSAPAKQQAPIQPQANQGQLPGVFGGQSQSGTVQMAQSNDPRIGPLEEEIRTLNGRIEDLNFQILQLQEQLRKTQEDNEFRFQELEKKSEGSHPAKKSEATSPVAPATAASTDTAPTPDPNASGSVVASDQTATTPAQSSSPPVAAAPVPVQSGSKQGLGAPAKTFGTITFDANGNVTGGDVGDKMTTVQGSSQPDGSTVVAALPQTNDPEELYRNSYSFILSGDYATAEAGFRDHINRFPTDGRAADSHFWLGEALLGQRKYRDAAEIFLDGTKSYPKAKKAPDMLLKLGVSLAGLDQHDVACATFLEVGKRYPEASGALKERVKQEQARASC